MLSLLLDATLTWEVDYGKQQATSSTLCSKPKVSTEIAVQVSVIVSSFIERT